MTTTVLLVDDHPLYREGLASALAHAGADMRLLGAGTLPEGLRILEAEPGIDLVLIDIVLPGSDGFAALACYGERFPQIPRVLISGREDALTIARASRAGASGFIGKSWQVADIVERIQRVLDGDVGFAPAPGGAVPAGTTIVPGGQASLTLRQIEVLTLLVQGKSNKEIARSLDIADRTVRAHLTELFQTLGVSSRVQAVLQAQQLGWVRV